MANLISPGVQVTVIDESFYAPADQGTRPLFIVASAENKRNGAGTSTAQGTLASNAGKVYLISSQRDLVDTFGEPTFKVDMSNNPVHAGEQNEYGLQAAYSYLGVANSAFVVRADLNLELIAPQTEMPGSPPADGTFWLDTASSTYGVFEWDGRSGAAGGQQFISKSPLTIIDPLLVSRSDTAYERDGSPLKTVGAIGDYAIAQYSSTSNDLKLWYKSKFGYLGEVSQSSWVLVGSDPWKRAFPTVQATNAIGNTVVAGDKIAINGYDVTAPSTNLQEFVDVINNTMSGVVWDGNKTITGTIINSGATLSSAGRIYLGASNVFGRSLSTSDNAYDGWVIKIGIGPTSVTKYIGFYNGTSQYVDLSSALVGIPADGTQYQLSPSTIMQTYPVRARIVDGLLQLYSTSEPVILSNRTNENTGTASTILSQLGLVENVYNYPPALQLSTHTDIPLFSSRDATPRPTGSIWIKTTEPNRGARWRVKVFNGNTQLWETKESPLYNSNETAIFGISAATGGIDIPVNSTYIQYNSQGLVTDADPFAEFRVMRRARTGATVVRSVPITSSTFVPATGTTNTRYRFFMAESITGSPVLSRRYLEVTIDETDTGFTAAQKIANAINSPAYWGTTQSSFANIVASVDTLSNRVVITHKLGGEIRFGDYNYDIVDPNDGTNFVDGKLGLASQNPGIVYVAPTEDSTYSFIASNWTPLTITPDTSARIKQMFYVSNTAPQTLAVDGTLWYTPIVDEVDIMVHNGKTWVGYLFDGAGADDSTANPYTASPYWTANPDSRTDPNGPIISSSEPMFQSDGTELQRGDLWIDTSDLENYPVIRRYNYDFARWDLIDNSDQTSENGILFADARWGNSGGATNVPPSGSIKELLTSNFLDFDAPDPALYPRGMLLWNLRRSGFNVKRFVRNHVNTLTDNIRYNSTFNDNGERPTSGNSQANYYPHRWVTESSNQEDGSGSFGRKAQRKVVIQALQAVVNSNQDLRDTEIRNFNLMACPGYPELIGEMVNLNYDRGLTAFVVGDTPARLTPDATTINEWGTNVYGALQDNDYGLVTSDEYLGIFYPWGYTSDNAGRDIAVPPSHMIMRTIALSDRVSYPWFAPAGTRRGNITNASNVGYVSREGEFVQVSLTEGQRDTLYNVKVNPITFFTGSGLVNFGQKTRARNASSLDRINVARLVIYLRGILDKLARPYIFEPNDKITRDEIKQEIESLMVELVGLRAIYDFLVVADESNNTPARIDRNELYVDIAIEPVKSVEFIYIPLRLKNTGEIKSGG